VKNKKKLKELEKRMNSEIDEYFSNFQRYILDDFDDLNGHNQKEVLKYSHEDKVIKTKKYMTRDEKMQAIVKILAKQWFYGDWIAETPNERVQEMLMRELGLYPFDSESDMIIHTQIDESIYKKAVNYYKANTSRLGLLSYEGDVFSVYKNHTNPKTFHIKDHHGKMIHMGVDADFVIRLYLGKMMATTSDGRQYNLGNEEPKPKLETLIDFLYGE
jgi:hypothetical protein